MQLPNALILLPPRSRYATGTGDLLRAYTVADGRWRFGARPNQVDPQFHRHVAGYEDKRFRNHPVLTPLALISCHVQAATTGRIVSGARP